MRRLLALAAAAATVAAMLVAGASPAFAYHTLGNHWAHNGLSHSQIYFVDETGSFWPVNTVTYKWNEAQGVDSYYVSSCPRSGLICPHVVEYNGASGSPDPVCNTAYGCTTRTLLPGSAKHYGTARVYLNNATVNTATQARKSTCQELGHVLGLEHRYAGVNSSCMTQGAAPPISAYPDTHDFDQLQTTYAHSN